MNAFSTKTRSGFLFAAERAEPEMRLTNSKIHRVLSRFISLRLFMFIEQM